VAERPEPIHEGGETENTGNGARGWTAARTDMWAALPRVRRLARIVLLAAVAMYLLSGIYVVQPDERGVVRRLGRVIADDVQPGIHYRAPWPVDQAATPQVTAIKRMSVGYRIVDELRGLAAEPRETQFVTGDENIIEVQLLIQYVVSNPADFLYATEEPHWLVRKTGEAVLTEKIASLGVDALLTTAKIEVAQAVKERAQELLDSYGAGVAIAAVHIQDISPPREVADAFRDVASAREDRSRIIQEANGYANRVVPMARGEAEGLVSAAEGYRTEKVKTAEGEAHRFRATVVEYWKSPAAARQRLYLESMETVLARVNKYVVDAGSGERLNLRFLSERRAAPSE
jgi:membrane protease subunit HflK